MGALSFAPDCFFDIFMATGGNPLDATGTISFSNTGFGIDNLTGVTWDDVANGTYTLINGTLDFTNLGNFGLVNAHDIGGGRQACFQVTSPRTGAASPGHVFVHCSTTVDVPGLSRTSRGRRFRRTTAANNYEFQLGGRPAPVRRSSLAREQWHCHTDLRRAFQGFATGLGACSWQDSGGP